MRPLESCHQPGRNAQPSAARAARATRVAALLTVAILGAPVSRAEAQAVISTGDGRVSVNADGVPLERLLAEFAKLVDLKVRLDPAVRERSVTVTTEPLPIADAFWRVLRAADVDAVQSAGEADRSIWAIVRASQGPESESRPVLAETGGRETVAPPTEPDAGPVGQEREDGEVEDEHAEQNALFLKGAESFAMPSELTSPQRLIQLLAPTGRPKVPTGGLIALPFPGPDGLPYTVPNTPPPPGIARLPFPDATGNQREVVVPASPPGQFMLPFPGPDGKPYTITVPPRPPAPTVIPGGPPSRRPGSR